MNKVELTSLVPVIDLDLWRYGSEIEKAELAGSVDDQLKRLGFFLLKNHGIPASRRSSARKAAEDFFALPEPCKRAYACQSNAYRGWIAQGLESNASSYGVDEDGEEIIDIKEAFSVGPVFDGFECHQKYASRWYAQNIWPDPHVPNFRKAMTDWWYEADKLTLELLKMLLSFTDLGEDWVEKNCNYPMATITANLYPEMNDSRGWRVGAHTDFGTLTILDRDNENGLQIEMEPGRWVDAPYIEDTLIINLGEMMVNLAKGRWKANPHRVVARPNAKRNLSLIYFHDPNYDTQVPMLNDQMGVMTAEKFLQNKMDQIIKVA